MFRRLSAAAAALILGLALVMPASEAFARGRRSSYRPSRPRSSSSSLRSKPVRVRGYIKKNGTYVAPHRRAMPRRSR